MLQHRRLILKGAAILIAAPVVAALTTKVVAADEADAISIKMTAKRFQYEPNNIELKAGQSAVLEITSIDFIHGLNIPDLKMRADLLPGRVTKVRVKFDKPGEYAFLCDNFCGSGHEEMEGRFIVK